MTVIRCGVIGHPVAHSRSPEIHRAFAKQTGVQAEYMLLDAHPADFRQSVEAFFEAGGRGLNVTLPHKAGALALADDASVEAQICGVANVLTCLSDGNLRADNVDGSGFLRDLARIGFDVAGKRVLILGAGGGAAGLLPTLLAGGVHSVELLNRTRSRAESLVKRLGEDRIRIADTTMGTPSVPFDLLVNATSASLSGDTPDFPSIAVGDTTLAYDLLYAPEPTPFMQRASLLGARAVDGWGMLIEQAAETFLLWHGVRPDTTLLHYPRS